ncbi:hypothetical protein BGW38_006730 [Lunasporangiospora selenospora]|uniref:BRCT domain-containing protein n=1 Tax=Lunasporangiospora selenospora TaxID=979761 RepID=A0A9P6KGS1_9FUNG|nr:hypothetical protein BGW38_006730 [Lunasporangiospora selenospora]
MFTIYFSADPTMIFSGIVLTTTGLPAYDRELIGPAIEDYGGRYSSCLSSDVTHMIALTASGDKYTFISERPELNIKVLLPQWFQTCCNLRQKLPETIYQLPDPPLWNPNCPTSRDDAVVPHLFSNSVKSVVEFLKSPSNTQATFLSNLTFVLSDDLSVRPEYLSRFIKKIQSAGGRVLSNSNEYSKETVDIVVCGYRTGSLYSKATKDGKTVGSADWLLHVLQTGEISSPKAWLLHYPIPPEPIAGMSSLIITVTNYTGPIREYLKRMIVATGATYTPTLCSRVASLPTTHIICGNASGDKFERGHEWNIKIVNHLWLEDCFQSWAIQSETKTRYTLFPAYHQLSLIFGAKIHPESIDEWSSSDRDDASPIESKSDSPTNPTASASETQMDNEKSQVVASTSSSNSIGSREGEEQSPPGYGAVRVTPRARGAALEASRALKKIVPDMNDFQAELQNEKRSLKKKKKQQTGEASREHESSDMIVDEADTETTSTAKKGSTPVKRKRTSLGRPGVGADGGAGLNDVDAHDDTAGGAKSATKKARRHPVVELSSAKDSADPAHTTDVTAAASRETRQVKFICTGMKDLTAKQIKSLKALGIMAAKSPEDCTHLVARCIARTEKFLVALALGKFIVREEWLQACIDASSILDESDYRIKDPDNEEKFSMDLYKSLECSREKKVFEDCSFYISPSTTPKPAVLKVLIEAGGGKASSLLLTGLSFLKDKLIRTNRKRAEALDGSGNSTAARGGDIGEDSDYDSDREKDNVVIVVSCDEDRDMWQPIVEAKSHVYSHELIISGILTQTLDLGLTNALA